jgi:hypothetical protein
VREEEKGIDVALAIDFVTMAVRGEYDVGVIMSTDTDLKPALEAVAQMRGSPYPEVRGRGLVDARPALAPPQHPRSAPLVPLA